MAILPLKLQACYTLDNWQLNNSVWARKSPSSCRATEAGVAGYGIRLKVNQCRLIKCSRGWEGKAEMLISSRRAVWRTTRCCVQVFFDQTMRTQKLTGKGGESDAISSRRLLATALGLGRKSIMKVDVYSSGIFKKKRSEYLQARSTIADKEVDIIGGEIADDYYSVLGVPPDANPEEIKQAYYSCMKQCHPDLGGDNEETTSFCMFINEIYEVLSDPVQRMVYDEINGYSLKSVNPFVDISRPKDHVFVDEFTCIGCKNCANTAPRVFNIEEDFGRARVVCQTGEPSLVQQAVETCPVDCIHWVSAAQLSLLEDEMRRVERVNVALMLSGMGFQVPDVFRMASWRWDKRQAKSVERAKIRMMKEKNKNASSPWWQGLWNQSPEQGNGQTSVNREARERAAKAAAAARRWREYSKKGADRRPFYNLPANMDTDAGEDYTKKPESSQN